MPLHNVEEAVVEVAAAVNAVAVADNKVAVHVAVVNKAASKGADNANADLAAGECRCGKVAETKTEGLLIPLKWLPK